MPDWSGAIKRMNDFLRLWLLKKSNTFRLHIIPCVVLFFGLPGHPTTFPSLNEYSVQASSGVVAMKRFAFLTIVLIVIASTTGCRRGLRLWGMRGGACTPTATPVPPAGVLPGAYAPAAQGVAPVYSPAVAPCPCEQPLPLEYGCGTEGVPFDPAYGGSTGPGWGAASPIVGDTGYNVGPNEIFGGDTGSGTIPANLAPSF